MQPGQLPGDALTEFNYSAPQAAAGRDATIVFNPSRQAEPEIAVSQGKSDYTRVLDSSRFRPQDAPAIAAPSSGAPAAPPTPQFTSPAPPAWAPPPTTPVSPWQPPLLTPAGMPQAPALTVPSPPVMPAILGDKLVSFLPFMLVLTVINFLGLLAGLIILFATRK